MSEYIKNLPEATVINAGDWIVFDTATQTFKISRQNLLGQMDLNKNAIAQNDSDISNNASNIATNASNILQNTADIDPLQSQINSGRIFNGASNGGSLNPGYVRVCVIDMPAQYDAWSDVWSLCVSRDGQLYNEDISISVRQSLAFGNDPVVSVEQIRYADTAFDIGYVIRQNSAPSKVEIWLKYITSHTYPSVWRVSMMKVGTATFEINTDNTVGASEPAGIVYASKNQYDKV